MKTSKDESARDKDALRTAAELAMARFDALDEKHEWTDEELEEYESVRFFNWDEHTAATKAANKLIQDKVVAWIKSFGTAGVAKLSQCKTFDALMIWIAMMTGFVILTGLGPIWLWRFVYSRCYDHTPIFTFANWGMWAVAWSGVIIAIDLWWVLFTRMTDSSPKVWLDHNDEPNKAPWPKNIEDFVGWVIALGILAICIVIVIAIIGAFGNMTVAAVIGIPPFLADHVHWVCGTPEFYVVVIPALVAAVAIASIYNFKQPGETLGMLKKALVSRQPHPVYEPDLDGPPVYE